VYPVKTSLAVVLIIILGFTAYYILSQNPMVSQLTNTPPREPTDVAPPPQIVVENSLIRSISSTPRHEIGFIVNNYNDEMYVIDLTSEKYLGPITFKRTGGMGDRATLP
jgi:hypothetical protein